MRKNIDRQKESTQLQGVFKVADDITAAHIIVGVEAS